MMEPFKWRAFIDKRTTKNGSTVCTCKGDVARFTTNTRIIEKSLRVFGLLDNESHIDRYDLETCGSNRWTWGTGSVGFAEFRSQTYGTAINYRWFRESWDTVNVMVQRRYVPEVEVSQPLVIEVGLRLECQLVNR